MKGTTGLLLTAVACALLSGCASTSESSAPAAYPTLKVLSDTPYVWDDSISEALNVARMAQPAGVGNGMRDFADGKLATTGRIGGGTRAVDAGLGLLSQGLFGVVSMEALHAGVNRQLDWKPAIVQFVPPKDVQADNTNSVSLQKLQKVVSERVKTSIESKFGKIDWAGVYSLKKDDISNVTLVMRNQDVCKNAMNFISTSKKHVGYVELNYKDHYINGEDKVEKHCVIALKSKIAGTVAHSGDLIVVSEIVSGHFFTEAIAANHPDYVIIPDFFSVNASDSAKEIGIYSDYAYVSKAGKRLMFQN